MDASAGPAAPITGHSGRRRTLRRHLKARDAVSVSEIARCLSPRKHCRVFSGGATVPNPCVMLVSGIPPRQVAHASIPHRCGPSSRARPGGQCNASRVGRGPHARQGRAGSAIQTAVCSIQHTACNLQPRAICFGELPSCRSHPGASASANQPQRSIQRPVCATCV